MMPDSVNWMVFEDKIGKSIAHFSQMMNEATIRNDGHNYHMHYSVWLALTHTLDALRAAKQ